MYLATACCFLVLTNILSVRSIAFSLHSSSNSSGESTSIGDERFRNNTDQGSVVSRANREVPKHLWPRTSSLNEITSGVLDAGPSRRTASIEDESDTLGGASSIEHKADGKPGQLEQYSVGDPPSNNRLSGFLREFPASEGPSKLRSPSGQSGPAKAEPRLRRRTLRSRPIKRSCFGSLLGPCRKSRQQHPKPRRGQQPTERPPSPREQEGPLSRQETVLLPGHRQTELTPTRQLAEQAPSHQYAEKPPGRQSTEYSLNRKPAEQPQTAPHSIVDPNRHIKYSNPIFDETLVDIPQASKTQLEHARHPGAKNPPRASAESPSRRASESSSDDTSEHDVEVSSLWKELKDSQKQKSVMLSSQKLPRQASERRLSGRSLGSHQESRKRLSSSSQPSESTSPPVPFHKSLSKRSAAPGGSMPPSCFPFCFFRRRKQQSPSPQDQLSGRPSLRIGDTQEPMDFVHHQAGLERANPAVRRQRSPDSLSRQSRRSSPNSSRSFPSSKVNSLKSVSPASRVGSPVSFLTNRVGSPTSSVIHGTPRAGEDIIFLRRHIQGLRLGSPDSFFGGGNSPRHGHMNTNVRKPFDGATYMHKTLSNHDLSESPNTNDLKFSQAFQNVPMRGPPHGPKAPRVNRQRIGHGVLELSRSRSPTTNEIGPRTGSPVRSGSSEYHSGEEHPPRAENFSGDKRNVPNSSKSSDRPKVSRRSSPEKYSDRTVPHVRAVFGAHSQHQQEIGQDADVIGRIQHISRHTPALVEVTRRTKNANVFLDSPKPPVKGVIQFLRDDARASKKRLSNQGNIAPEPSVGRSPVSQASQTSQTDPPGQRSERRPSKSSKEKVKNLINKIKTASTSPDKKASQNPSPNKSPQKQRFGKQKKFSSPSNHMGEGSVQNHEKDSNEDESRSQPRIQRRGMDPDRVSHDVRGGQEKWISCSKIPFKVCFGKPSEKSTSSIPGPDPISRMAANQQKPASRASATSNKVDERNDGSKNTPEHDKPTTSRSPTRGTTEGQMELNHEGLLALSRLEQPFVSPRERELIDKQVHAVEQQKAIQAQKMVLNKQLRQKGKKGRSESRRLSLSAREELHRLENERLKLEDMRRDLASKRPPRYPRPAQSSVKSQSSSRSLTDSSHSSVGKESTKSNDFPQGKGTFWFERTQPQGARSSTQSEESGHSNDFPEGRGSFWFGRIQPRGSHAFVVRPGSIMDPSIDRSVKGTYPSIGLSSGFPVHELGIYGTIRLTIGRVPPEQQGTSHKTSQLPAEETTSQTHSRAKSTSEGPSQRTFGKKVQIEIMPSEPKDPAGEHSSGPKLLRRSLPGLHPLFSGIRRASSRVRDCTGCLRTNVMDASEVIIHLPGERPEGMPSPSSSRHPESGLGLRVYLRQANRWRRRRRRQGGSRAESHPNPTQEPPRRIQQSIDRAQSAQFQNHERLERQHSASNSGSSSSVLSLRRERADRERIERGRGNDDLDSARGMYASRITDGSDHPPSAGSLHGAIPFRPSFQGAHRRDGPGGQPSRGEPSHDTTLQRRSTAWRTKLAELNSELHARSPSTSKDQAQESATEQHRLAR